MKTFIQEFKENALEITAGIIVAGYIITAIVIATIEHINYFIN